MTTSFDLHDEKHRCTIYPTVPFVFNGIIRLFLTEYILVYLGSTMISHNTYTQMNCFSFLGTLKHKSSVIRILELSRK